MFEHTVGAWYEITYQYTKVPRKPPWTGGKCNPNPSGPSCRPGPFLKENGHLYYSSMMCAGENKNIHLLM